MPDNKGKAGPKESNYSESIGKYPPTTPYAKEYRNNSTALEEQKLVYEHL